MKICRNMIFWISSSLFLASNFLFAEGITKEEFSSWWVGYRSDPNVPSELRTMEDYVVNSGVLPHASDFWNSFNKYNIQQITLYGYENFKVTVTRNYFTWVVNANHGYSRNLLRIPSSSLVYLPPEEMNKVHPFFTPEESMQFNMTIRNFLSYILSIGGAPFLEKLQEPMIGNPPFLLYQNKRVSQDIFNSLLEYLAVTKHCSTEKISTIIEIGAGSGRTAFCFLTLLPKVKYVIADFPPALYISQKYLSAVFPNKRVMTFRPFNTFEEISEEFQKAEIVFLTPDQLKKLPKKCGDLFLAIDCLHEMRPEEISRYFNEAERLCSYFYFKCWQTTVCDGNFYSSESYPVRPRWKVCFKEPCFVPSDFFHALYEMPNANNKN
jgi:putative sugar O-methyltransferase